MGHVKEADFAILYAKASNRKEYLSSLTSALADSVAAVNGKFVEDCISSNQMLDYKPYVFVPPSPKRKRTTSAQPPSSGESTETDEPLSQKSRSKQIKIEKPSSSKSAKLSRDTPSKSKMSPQVHQTFPAPTSSRTSPSKSRSTVVAKPPPLRQRVTYKYTEEEIELAMKIAFDYYAEDYRKSETQLGKILHAKVCEKPLQVDFTT